MSILRWGVISTARIAAKSVVPAIVQSRNGRLVAVGSRSLEGARRFAAPFGPDVRAYGGYAALLADPDVDAIYNSLPNSLHAEWTIQALQAGKHVLCEKPLGTSLAEVDQMIEVAQASGRQLMEAFMYRFHPRTERALALLQAGSIGRLRLIRASFSFPLTDAANIRLSAPLMGGGLMDVGCYCVNIARTAVAAVGGGEPLRVAAFADIGAASGVDEAMSAIVRFPDAITLHFDCGLRVERRQEFELVGSEGLIRVPDAFNAGRLDGLLLQQRHGGELVAEERFDGVDQYRCMVEHFADAVLAGTPLRYTMAESRGNMATIAALVRSVASGQVEPVIL